MVFDVEVLAALSPSPDFCLFALPSFHRRMIQHIVIFSEASLYPPHDNKIKIKGKKSRRKTDENVNNNETNM